MGEDFVTDYCVVGCEELGFLEALLSRGKEEGKRVGLVIDLIKEGERFDDIRKLISMYDNLLIVDSIKRDRSQIDYIRSEFLPYCFVGEGGIYLKKEQNGKI